MIDRITAALSRLFEQHRIVFWTDAAHEMRDAFDNLALDGVEKVEIANNEFGLKYRMLKQEPEKRFLVFRDGPDPEMKDNWLLDLQLAYTVFKADQAAILTTELALPAHLEATIREHGEFFKSTARLEALKKAIKPNDTQTQLRLRMLSVCTGAEGKLDTVIERLLDDLSRDKDDGLRVIERSGLTGFFWEQVSRTYGYDANEADFEDFAMSFFESAWARSLGEDGKLNDEAFIAFGRWMNNRRSTNAFEALSARYQEVLQIPAQLKTYDLKSFAASDYFEEIDREFIRQVVHGISESSLAPVDVLKWVRGRRQSHWYDRYKDVYQAIEFGTEFQQMLNLADLTISSPEDGFRRYTTSWFKLDQLYRKFIYHMQNSGQMSLLSELAETVENLYTNRFVVAVNNAWQDQVAKMDQWSVTGFPSQTDFYRERAAEYRRKKQKVAVVISDALRFEVADECLHRIRSLNRFDAELSSMTGALPSYTQLGMAALLPHSTLEIGEDGNLVLADGESTAGVAAREKRLASGRDGDRVKAVRADDFLNMLAGEAKTVFRDHDVLYIYHNRIDAAGDKISTEEHLPEAVEKTIDELTRLVQKLTTANATNILVTADHGFLYQHRPLDEAEFSISVPEGDEILTRNRRFVVGRDLSETAGMKKFSAAQLGLSGDLDVLIPNSINRLRVKGSGSRYVHGGATLQEIAIPVLRVGKQREADLREVDVQIIVSGRSIITSGQISLMLFQKEAVTEKVRPRMLSAGLFAADGTLISNEQTVAFDFPSENPREREIPVKFMLSREADQFNNQNVYLKLREKIGKTTRYEEYASHQFELRRGITSDFDF